MAIFPAYTSVIQIRIVEVGSLIIVFLIGSITWRLMTQVPEINFELGSADPLYWRASPVFGFFTIQL
jgi:hypothetical protein